MFCHYFSLLLCVVAYSMQDGEWFKCKPKPGCSIARCDPRPAGQWFGNDGLHNEYPILCQQNEASSPVTAGTETVNQFNEIRIELAKLEGRLQRSEKVEYQMNSDMTLLEKKNAEIESEMDRVRKEAEESKKERNGAMKQFTSLEKTNSEMRNEMDSMKKKAEEDKGKLNDAMKRTIWPSCDDLPRSNHESRDGKSGIFNIIQSATLYEVYCDMTTDGGGWTVFQRRMDGSVDFYRDWEEYATGFGNKSGEFWLGLEAVHQLTQDGAYELRVDLTDWDGRTGYAKYGTFSISGRSDNYRLTVGEYSGTAGNSLAYHSNNRLFSAKNKDLDGWSGDNCATLTQAAWWFGYCAHSSLNGRYNDTSGNSRGVWWYHWKNRTPYSLKASEMKFRKK